VTRLLASIVETSHDERGIVWPVAVAPYKAVVVAMTPKDADVQAHARNLYADLQRSPYLANDVALDDSADSPGAKLHRAQLLGTWREIIIILIILY
jgi:prolyl-tRNA synthetase